MTSSPIPPVQSAVQPVPSTAGEVKKTAAASQASGQEEKKKKKEKKGLFANFRKKLKSGGGEKSEEVKSERVRGDKGGKGTTAGVYGAADVSGAADGGSEAEREERERLELYKAIGYSENEEYVEFPREVSTLKLCHLTFLVFCFFFRSRLAIYAVFVCVLFSA